MNISEVAKLVGLSSKQIRDYEKSGLLKPAQRSSSREVKALTTQHIKTLNEQIHHLQKMVEELERWHNACQGNDGPECSILEGLKG